MGVDGKEEAPRLNSVSRTPPRENASNPPQFWIIIIIIIARGKGNIFDRLYSRPSPLSLANEIKFRRRV